MLKRRVAMLLTFVLAFTNVMPAMATETTAGAEYAQTSVSQESTQPGDEGEKTGTEEPEGEDRKDNAPDPEEAEKGKDAGETETGEKTPDDEPAGLSEDAAAGSENVSENEAETVSNNTEPELPAGVAPVGEPVDEENIPQGWQVDPVDAAKWYTTGENKYNVYLSKGAFIRYYPGSYYDSTDAGITVFRAENAEDDTVVIVQGGQYGQGTSVSVDNSLSQNAYVAHGSIVETDTDFHRVGGLDKKTGEDLNDDYEEGDINTVQYRSGWRVYAEQSSQISIGWSVRPDAHNGSGFTSIIYSADDKDDLIGTLSAHSMSYTIGENLKERTRSASADFAVKAVDGVSWLHLDKIPDVPDLSKLKLEMELYDNTQLNNNYYSNPVDNYGIRIRSDRYYSDYELTVSSDYMDYGSQLRSVYSGDYAARELGALGCDYYIYVRTRGNSWSDNNKKFASDWVKYTPADSIYVPLRSPAVGDVSEISMSENKVTLSQNNEDFGNEYYYDKRGCSKLKFLVTESGISANTVSQVDVSQWKAADLYAGREVVFEKRIKKDGASENLAQGQQLDVYGAWFLPRIESDGHGGYIQDFDGMGQMCGQPVKLYSFTYAKDGSLLIPEIKCNTKYTGKNKGQRIGREYPGEDEPLFTDKMIEQRFSVKTVDSSEQEVPGDLILKAVSVNDPQAEAFLKQTTLSDGSIGRDVTEAGGWDTGDYYLLAYFKPDHDEYIDVIKKFDLRVLPVTLKTETSLDLSGSVYSEYETRFLPKGYEIKLEDFSTKLYYTEWVYDENTGYDYEKKTEDTEHRIKDAKYLIRVVSGNVQWKYDEETGEDIYEYPYDKFYVISKENPTATLEDEGKFRIMLYNILGGTVTDNEGNEDINYTGTFGAYSYWDEAYESDPEIIKENEKYGYNSYSYSASFDVRVLDAGEINVTARGHELPYGVANQMLSDAVNGYGSARQYRCEQMDRVLYISSNGDDIYYGQKTDPKLKYCLDYLFAASETGSYDSIDKLSKEDLELGKTVWVKALVLGKALSNPVSLKIGKQPINIAAVCPTATNPGEELNGTYRDDIYVYYMNPYPNENPRELRSGLAEWTDSDKASIDLTGIDKDSEGTQKKTRLSIALSAAKSTHYELRSTAAIYIVRSSGAIAPKSGGAISVDEDKKTEVKKKEIRHEMYTVQFIDAKTGEKLADSMGWEKEKGLPSDISLNLKKSNFGAWSMGSDCSKKRIDITTEGIVTGQGNLYSFDLDGAMSYLKGQGVSVITFYGYETENVNKYIRINEIAPVSFNGQKHVSTGEKGKGKSTDLFISVQLVNDDGVVTLTEGTDYSLKYSDNKNAGEGTVTVVGKGAYKGLSSKRNFTINPTDITEASVVVNPSYKFGSKGISVTPKVILDGKTLKSGEGKDYTFKLVEEDLSEVKGSYDKNSASHKFRVKVTGQKDYSGTVYSEVFWGVPSNLKALNVTLGATTAAFTDSRPFVTAEDFFTSSSKVTNYSGSVSAQLYDLDYRPLEKGVDTGVSYYVGVRATDPASAIENNISPAVTYKKVRFTGLKFNKNMFELSSTAFEFTNSNNAVKVQAKSGASVSWADVQVTFSDYYAPDGDEDLPLAKGTKEPQANDGKGANILDNLYPGTYTVFLTGTGRYYGSFKLTYKVNPMKAVVGQNMDIIVNDGNKVFYNAAGYDMTSAPVKILIKGSGRRPDTLLSNIVLNASYGAKSSVADGGTVNVGAVYTVGGTKVFKNSVRKSFGISACDLKAALGISGNGYGAVKKTTVNLGAKVPLLTLFQFGPMGNRVIPNGEFSTEDIRAKAAKNPDSAFDLEITPKNVNYSGSKFTVSGVDAYESSYTKAKLKLAPGNKAELEGGTYEKKNSKGNQYFKYTGKPVEPGVVIKAKDGTVISEEFYDVTYENNVMYSTSKTPALAIVEFKRSDKSGKFPYGGRAEVKFYIVTDYAAESK